MNNIESLIQQWRADAESNPDSSTSLALVQCAGELEEECKSWLANTDSLSEVILYGLCDGLRVGEKIDFRNRSKVKIGWFDLERIASAMRRFGARVGNDL